MGFKEPTSFFLYLALFISALILDGCITKIQEFQQKFFKSLRQPGENMVASPEDISKIYSCSQYKQTMLFLEDGEVIPKWVFPGEDINHRIRYALCPYIPSGTLKGQIIRTILFKGEAMFKDVTNYEFKPGAWTVDVFIDIPYNAQAGVYAVDVILSSNTQEEIITYDSFIVKSR